MDDLSPRSSSDEDLRLEENASSSSDDELLLEQNEEDPSSSDDELQLEPWLVLRPRPGGAGSTRISS